MAYKINKRPKDDLSDNEDIKEEDEARPYAVITGASSGIGAALATFLLSKDWNICLIARSLDKMEELTKKYKNDRYLNVKCDISNAQKCIEACDKINKWCGNALHLLVNNAGYAKLGMETESESSTLEHWDHIMAVNLRAPYIFTKYLLPSLKNGAKEAFDGKYDGSIINISTAYSMTHNPPTTPYNISKAGLNSLTKCTAKEFAKYRLRVNAIVMAAFDTPALKATGFPDMDMFKNVILPSVHPMGRIGNVNDTNQMVLFLCDKTKSGFTTGALINSDGGFLLGMPPPSNEQKKKDENGQKNDAN